MSIPLPVFIAIPLIVAFVLPIFSSKGRAFAMFLAQMTTVSLLVLAIISIGQYRVYEIGNWSIPLGINLVLDGLSSLLLLAIGVVSAAAMLFSVRYMDQYTAKAKYLSLFLLMVAGMNGVVLSGDIFNLFVFLEIASIASYALLGYVVVPLLVTVEIRSCTDVETVSKIQREIHGGPHTLTFLAAFGAISFVSFF